MPATRSAASVLQSDSTVTTTWRYTSSADDQSEQACDTSACQIAQLYKFDRLADSQDMTELDRAQACHRLQMMPLPSMMRARIAYKLDTIPLDGTRRTSACLLCLLLLCEGNSDNAT